MQLEEQLRTTTVEDVDWDISRYKGIILWLFINQFT